MGEFAQTGGLDPTPANIDPSAFFEGAWNTTIVDGTSYGVPWYVETRVLYYRTDIARKAGITKPPTNWEELKAAAKAMKEKGGAKYGIALSPDNWQEFMPFVWQNGGDVIDGDKFTFQSPEVVEALDYYKSFFTDKLTAPSVPEGFDVTQGFIAGTHPMFFSGPWHMGLIEDQGGAKLEGKWNIALMPEEESRTSFVGGSDLVVFKGASNKPAAWKFVEYLMQPEVQQKWYQVVSDLPSLKSGVRAGRVPGATSSAGPSRPRFSRCSRSSWPSRSWPRSRSASAASGSATSRTGSAPTSWARTTTASCSRTTSSSRPRETRSSSCSSASRSRSRSACSRRSGSTTASAS
jgi:multiple sugar transport system substrate-binding protein